LRSCHHLCHLSRAIADLFGEGRTVDVQSTSIRRTVKGRYRYYEFMILQGFLIHLR
jgi:hypothetical protein